MCRVQHVAPPEPLHAFSCVLTNQDNPDSDSDAALTNTTLTIVEHWFEELTRLVRIP